MFGIRGVSIGSILLIVAIIALFFGTKRLRNMAEDVAAAKKGFKKGLGEQEESMSEHEHSDAVSNDRSSRGE